MPLTQYDLWVTCGPVFAWLVLGQHYGTSSEKIFQAIPLKYYGEVDDDV